MDYIFVCIAIDIYIYVISKVGGMRKEIFI